LFTNGTHVLAGFQPKKKVPCITGIGGCREAGETFLYTAIRETVEELLNVTNVPAELIYTLSDKLQPGSIFSNNGYTTVVYSFHQLETFLRIVQGYGIVTGIYRDFPTTLEELVVRRKTSTDAEIRQFAILPLECSQISKDFLVDLQMALELYEPEA